LKRHPRNVPEHKPHLRADVAWALHQILDVGKSTNEILPIGIARYQKAEDKAWFQECLYGCLRDVPLFQHWTNLLLTKSLDNKGKIAEKLIMVGLFQLHAMRTPDHAAISETVNAVKIAGYPRYSGVINAVLRRFLRDKIAQIPIDVPHIRYGMPKWLLKQIRIDYPDTWEPVVKKSNEKPPIFLRINRLAVEPEGYIETLKSNGISFEKLSEFSIKLKQNINVTELPGYADGAFSVQDYAAQHSARLLDPKENESILDCCAAPGGKASGIYEYCPNISNLLAIDSDQLRVNRMIDNFKRLTHTADKLQVRLDDASTFSTLDDQQKFDRILLDAPCSATGIIRRHPDIKWLRKRADIDALVAIQKKILEQAWQRLKEGGTLLYATCSILKAENVEQICWFLSTHSDAEWIKIHPDESVNQPGWQILPGEKEMDGFYYAKLRKRQT